MSNHSAITVSRTCICLPGDGIGPEVMAAAKRVVEAARPEIPFGWVDMPAGLGAVSSHGTPMPQETLDAIAGCRLALKGPTNTPKGTGHSSVNVLLRKHFDLHVGFRPFVSMALPTVPTREPVDIILFRQNTEGLYACGETLDDHGTPDVHEDDEVILTAKFTAKAMFRLARHAFAFAQANRRRRVSIITKSNIHKEWGALYRRAFMKVAADYPGLQADELLVDATGMMAVADPHKLDVIVTENMFGDILSDVCAGLIGGLGVAPGANIGDDCAIFEAVHGSADDIAGKGLANPTALILSAAMLLRHVGENAAAVRIETAVKKVLAGGSFITGDLLKYASKGARSCSTEEYTDAVCRRLATL